MQNKKEISAKIIADSTSENGDRLTTFVLTFPRIVLAEFNTHRAFSRNSASSRAIPFEKMVNMVEEDPFIPIAWMKDHSGMQGTEFFSPDAEEGLLIRDWLEARDYAVQSAKGLSEFGLTKQIVNRLLEPFMWHTVIVTASDYENFFALRAHEAAEIHIQALAYKMLEEYNKSQPKLLIEDEWHIPFGDNIDTIKLQEIFNITSSEELEDYKLKIATARCARVSYMNFEGKDDYKADIALYDRLAEMGHWSPFEHCATPLQPFYARTGNFKGWKQLRGTFFGENRNDLRVIKKGSEDVN